MFENYILAPDGKDYVDVDDVRAVLGIKEYENIFRAIEEMKDKINRIEADLELTNKLYKENRDFVDKVCEAVDITRPYTESDYDNAVKSIAGFKRERDKLKKRANAAYGVSCGYSGDKASAFLCDVISYSWEFGSMLNSDAVRVKIELALNANHNGSYDLEDLFRYIQDYGREKKLGVLESVDYQNAKAARAELAYLYKQVLGKERLDTDLSPHEVMKAILDEYKRVRDSQFVFSQCLRSVYMEIHEGTGYDINDIYAAPDKLADGIITRYNSARMSSRLETLSEIDEHIDELCDKYNAVQPDRKSTTKERIDYIFGVLAEHRDLANNNFNKAEGFRKEKRAVENVLAELRAKVREIYCSVVDDEWDEYLAYTSALNDINEEYKRVVHNFEERTADWSKEQQELDRYMLAVGSLCNIPAEHRDDISWIEDAFNNTKKDYLKWQTQADKLARLRSNICTALCLGGETRDEDILNAITKMREKCNDLIVFRNDVSKAIGLAYIDINSDIINRVMRTKECHDKLCEDYTELRKAIWDAMDRKPETLPDETARLVGEVRMLQLNYQNMRRFERDYGAAQKILSDISDFRKWAIEELKQHGIVESDLEHPEHIDVTGSDIFRKLLKRYNWAYGEYMSQYHLRQQWHERYESEHTRANGEHKRAEKLRSDVTALKNHIELLKLSNASQANSIVASQAFKNECRKLKEEKAKVIAALGQDIWDDCVK